MQLCFPPLKHNSTTSECLKLQNFIAQISQDVTSPLIRCMLTLYQKFQSICGKKNQLMFMANEPPMRFLRIKQGHRSSALKVEEISFSGTEHLCRHYPVKRSFIYHDCFLLANTDFVKTCSIIMSFTLPLSAAATSLLSTIELIDLTDCDPY